MSTLNNSDERKQIDENIKKLIEREKMLRRRRNNSQEEMDKTIALKWLRSWMVTTRRKKLLEQLPFNIEKFFKRDNNYTKLYRGLHFSDSKISKYLHTLTEKDLTKYKLGDYIPIKLTQLTSWSTSYDSAIEYSDYGYYTKNGVLVKDIPKETYYGIMLELENVKRYSVLADVNESLDDDDESSDNEIILYPGTFRCKLIKIYKNGKEQESLTFDLQKYNSIDD